MSKPIITLKHKYSNGDIQSIELFEFEKAFILHRHVLTDNHKRAKMYQIFRKFSNKWYCMQELVITKEEYNCLKSAYRLQNTNNN